MKTRERILATALRLFNESGTAAISTNHIAEALGISPGNLYYHFRNKEEIIRALFEQQFDYTDKLYALPQDRLPSLEDLMGLVRATFVMSWEYRFIYRELIALLRRDDLLQRRWAEVRARGFAGFHALFGEFVAAGVLRSTGDAAVVERVADLCWLLSEYWLPSVEVSGVPVEEAQFERGIELMMQVLAPYIAAPAS
ncbi:MAG TPA: TetR/AcrR family transcriptional regulator [Kouleothrix sp.]|uniref:TetR/AcrR family transcriptional regulator n=1 Tax=Kouleothrix sp. TaxID=2779161 RepID=UPI002B50E399|nr:TetR/AcrR family transcriptional regulator [Kouleothrix sp.]HRC78059.1 TetR/AcrR family transcriptional regulator [Kouleothrix sp.]